MTDRYFMIAFRGSFDDKYFNENDIENAVSSMIDSLENSITGNYRVAYDFDFKHEYNEAYGLGWQWELADNGWADHVCPFCGFRVNDDIHVHLGWKYCPNCGNFVGVGRQCKKKEGVNND